MTVSQNVAAVAQRSQGRSAAELPRHRSSGGAPWPACGETREVRACGGSGGQSSLPGGLSATRKQSRSRQHLARWPQTGIWEIQVSLRYLEQTYPQLNLRCHDLKYFVQFRKNR